MRYGLLTTVLLAFWLGRETGAENKLVGEYEEIKVRVLRAEVIAVKRNRTDRKTGEVRELSTTIRAGEVSVREQVVSPAGEERIDDAFPDTRVRKEATLRPDRVEVIRRSPPQLGLLAKQSSPPLEYSLLSADGCTMALAVGGSGARGLFAGIHEREPVVRFTGPNRTLLKELRAK
jgi:hypothetical protein